MCARQISILTPKNGHTCKAVFVGHCRAVRFEVATIIIICTHLKLVHACMASHRHIINILHGVLLTAA